MCTGACRCCLPWLHSLLKMLPNQAKMAPSSCFSYTSSKTAISVRDLYSVSTRLVFHAKSVMQLALCVMGRHQLSVRGSITQKEISCILNTAADCRVLHASHRYNGLLPRLDYQHPSRHSRKQALLLIHHSGQCRGRQGWLCWLHGHCRCAPPWKQNS